MPRDTNASLVRQRDRGRDQLEYRRGSFGGPAANVNDLDCYRRGIGPDLVHG
jgi:hypothetical protein